MKKIILASLFAFSIIVLSGCTQKPAVPTASTAPTARPRKADVNVNTEPVAQRPYVRLTPINDGKAIELSIIELKKTAKDLEYEIEYSAGALLQGAFGSIDALSTLPVRKEILLGSCSSGGKCTYNKDVTGGNLTLRFGNPDLTFKSEWSYTENALKGKTFSSRDGKFSLDVSKAKNTANFVLIHQAPGYPGSIDGTVVAGPYVVAPADKITGTVSVSIRLPLEVETGTLYAWDGKAWKEWKGKLADRTITASGTMSEIYMIVQK